MITCIIKRTAPPAEHILYVLQAVPDRTQADIDMYWYVSPLY